jgi:hypothetical protein
MRASARMSVYIATPMFGGRAHARYCDSLMRLLDRLDREGIDAQVDAVGNESLIQRARNLMADRFLRSRCTHLLFIDSDIAFEPDEVMRLLRSGLPLASGAYPKKFYDWAKIRARLDAGAGEPARTAGLDYNVNLDPVTLGLQGGFAPVLDTATGFLLIAREVLQAVHAAHPELECVNDITVQTGEVQRQRYRAVFECMIDPDSRRYLSEDFSFLRRAQALGYRAHCDLQSRLTHIGTLELPGACPVPGMTVAPPAIDTA